MENNIKQHKEYDFFETDGRKFKLNAFDPIEGNCILFQVFSFFLSFVIVKALSSKFFTE